MLRLLFFVVGILTFADCADQTKRLRVTNSCPFEDLWLQYLVGAGCGSLPDEPFLKVAPGGYYDYSIPDEGLCGFRVWPLLRCGAAGKALGLSGDEQDCEIGSSGGNDYCPGDMVTIDGKIGSIGCGPPIDSKFEGTFGCTKGNPAECRTTPQGQSLFGVSDSWDTSLVDGWTVPFKVTVKDDCTASGPKNNMIDCTDLTLDKCPTDENLTAGDPSLAHINLTTTHPVTGRPMGCKAPCARLSKGQWFSIPSPPFNGTTYPENSAQAEWYCCPSSITPDACRHGPVIDTEYVKAVHTYCPQVYAYSYDETATAGALWSCKAGTRYEIEFSCPSKSRESVIRTVTGALQPQ